MVEQTINYEEINQYSQAFARRLNDYFFIDHSFISGKDILSFCDIKQVNLLIIKNLYEKWQEETARLKSPYFDYQNQQVQDALQTFMNVLSKHIQIQKQHFYPLLVNATKDTLTLILDPKAFYTEEIRKRKPSLITTDSFSDMKKYIQYNKQLFSAFMDRLAGQAGDGLSTEQAIDLLEAVYDNNQHYIEPMDWRLQNFTDIHHLDMDRLFMGDGSSQLQLVSEDTPTQVAEDAPTVIENYPSSGQSDSDQPRVLNDAHKKATQNTNILEQFQQASISNIRSAISLNQKFLFINKLFNGDSFAFNDAVSRIEDCNTYDEARHLVNQEYSVKYGWDFESEEAQSFFEILERRFN